jgi:casein kinase II subunit alpha
MSDNPFSIANSCINHRFNPSHPYVSRIYANTNLDLGPSHWGYRDWNPTFGNIGRYDVLEWVGEGRYSDVFLALRDGVDLCAVKLLKPVNTDRVRRELKILMEVQGFPTILHLYDIVIDGKVGIPAVVTEAIQGNQPWRQLFASMTLDDARFYLYRVVQALDYTHRRGIMHRDVKPLNILCNGPRQDVRLADWGLAEFYHPMRKYSCQVATRYYKPPEILLGYEYYDYSIDMWSVGVMLLEILTQKLHVFDGRGNDRQLDVIVEVVGGQKVLDWAEKYRMRLSQTNRDKLVGVPGIPFESLIPYARSHFRDTQALDLVEHLLTVDHKDRLTAEEALGHPFFQLVRDTDGQVQS